ncbi:Hint domain-containing protein [Pseudogemmobacter bohemicus]|uniref:Hint domain-containing protein n=1 Tax=Pseudogemmobacter bohemicus TaxID=2250708 RepID=UPI001E3EBD59|nr:Hint domain-containing protein [Pseudogemmobacter bohemicus]
MSDYVVYVYTADMFTYTTASGQTFSGLPAEASGGVSAVNVTAANPITVRLLEGARPIAITIRDTDTGNVRVNNQNWVNSNLRFDEVSTSQHILGGSYHPGSSINAAYTYTGATAWNGEPLSLVTYRLGGNGPDTGPVQGVMVSQGLVPGTSYKFTGTYTTQSAPGPYPHYYDPTDPPAPCFTSGTLLATEHGQRRIEDLQIGDTVLTMDHGSRRIEWIACRQVDSATLLRKPSLAPIRIRAGALGGGLPTEDLIVSPQHRVLVRSRLAIRMFDGHEVLVAAKHLVGIPGIEVVTDGAPVTYWHLLLDQHEVVFSNGAPTETLFTGPEAMRAMSAGQREEILTLFPDCIERALAAPARQLANGRRSRSMVRRTIAHNLQLLEHTL